MILKLSSAGPEVGQLHQALIEDGYSLEASELTGQTFGHTTHAAVADFQTRHVDAEGHRLLADGIVGPKTLQAIQHPAGPGDRFVAPGWTVTPSAIPDAVRGAVNAAVADIGKIEQPDGSNSGPQIAHFFPSKEAQGQPWCAYAVSHWLGCLAGGCPWGILASAWKIRTWAKGFAAMVDPNDARPGDVWLAIRAGGHGHVGLIVHRFEGGDQVATVEGNAGNAVRGCVRSASSATMIIRPA